MKHAFTLSIRMLIFHCTGCKGTIATGDHERPSRVFDKLGEHIADCPLATFTFEGTTDIARERADYIRAILANDRVADKLRLH